MPYDLPTLAAALQFGTAALFSVFTLVAVLKFLGRAR